MYALIALLVIFTLCVMWAFIAVSAFGMALATEIKELWAHCAHGHYRLLPH